MFSEFLQNISKLCNLDFWQFLLDFTRIFQHFHNKNYSPQLQTLKFAIKIFVIRHFPTIFDDFWELKIAKLWISQSVWIDVMVFAEKAFLMTTNLKKS